MIYMDIDNLSIEISASAQKAEQQINKLISSLGNLSKKLNFDTTSLQNLSKLNGDNFSKIGDGIKNLADSMKQMQSVKKADFNRLAAGIERLGKIDAGNMSTVGNSLKPLADGINTLSNANFNNGNLQNFINSLTRLSNANVSNISASSLKSVGTAIKQLATDLSEAPKIQQSVISMTNAIASLARSGANIPTVTTSLGQLGSSLKKFMSDMSQAPMVASETIAFTQAIGTLASAGTKAQTTANGLAELGDKLKKLITSLSTAPKVSDNVIKLTSALAQLAGTGSKTGRAANSLKNGFDLISSSSIKSDLNIKKLTQSMNGLKNAMSKTAMGVKSFGQQLMAAMGIYVSVFGAIQGVKKSIDISSSLTEVQNVVDVTFGTMSSKVEEFTKNSIEQFGMSELSAKQFASRFQAMGTAMGINNKLISGANGFLNNQTKGYVGLSDSMADVSLNLTKLTADMASFYNVEQKAVAEDLESIFTGQTRPLRTYGLDLTQATLSEWAMKNGLDADIKSMSQAEKTMLRYQYVLANTGAAQNDFSRTSQTWANQTRILKQQLEQLGSVLGGTFINLLKPLVQALNKAMSSIIAFAQTVSNALGKIFGWKFEVQGGVANDLELGEDAAGGIADDMGTAADNAKKLNKQLRAFDELKTINLKDSNKSGSGSGAGGAGANAGQGEWVKTDGMFKDYESNLDSLYKLGDYIGKTLTDTLNGINWDSVYEGARNFGKGLAEFLNGLISPELFGALGRTVAGCINTAFRFLDSFGEWFNWSNFGYSLATGLNEFMRTLDWETALSAARNWGTGIAKALNSFISETDFYEVGATIANALNTAIEFELSFAETFNFENFGAKIAEAVNGFFETFNFDDLARSINLWVDGILSSIIKFIEKTNWDLIGTKIGKFIADINFTKTLAKVGKAIWKAINASIKTWSKMFSAAPIETALLSIATFPKLLKAITQSKFVTGLTNIANAFKLVTTGIAGNMQSITTLTGEYPKLGKAVDVLNDSFQRMMFGFHYGDFFGGINAGITNIRNNLTGLQKGAITAIAGIAEFSIISDTLEGLTLGTENLVAGIAKIGATVSVAAGAMYTAFGPAGLAVAGITATVAGIKGISDAFDTIKAESIGEAIKNALTNPGGTPLEDVVTNVADSIRSIGDNFSSLNQRTQELETSRQNIKNVWQEIELVRTQMDNGVITVEDGVARLNELFAELSTTASEEFKSLELTLLSAFGENGVLKATFEELGIDTEKVTGAIVTSTANVETKVNELTSLLATTDPSNPKYATYLSELNDLTGGYGELEKAVSDYALAVDTANIDYSKIIGDDNTLDTTYVTTQLDTLTLAVKNANSGVTEGVEGVRIALQENLDKALAVGDTESAAELETALSYIPDALSNLEGNIQTQATTLTNVMQNDVVGGINGVIENAQKEWENMNFLEKAFNGGNEGNYIKEAVDNYQTNVIDPLSSQIETAMGQLGIEGAGWSSEAGQKIISGLFDSKYIHSDMGTGGTQYTLKDNYSSIIRQALDDTVSELEADGSAKEVGRYVIEGAGVGVIENACLYTDSLTEASQLGQEAFDEDNGINSPSTVYADKGKYIVEGLGKGIEDNAKTVISKITTLSQNVQKEFSTIIPPMHQIGVDAMQGLLDGLASKESELYKKAQSIADNISRTIQNALDIGSPSKVMFELGGYTMQGFQNGLESFYKPILSSLSDFSANLEPAPIPSIEPYYKGQQLAYNSYLPQTGILERGEYGQDNAETNALLRELIAAVKAGKTITIDGETVGQSAVKYIQGEEKRLQKSIVGTY